MKRVVLFSISIILLFCSCKHKESKIISFEENDTLKAEILKKESETLWTRELEPDVLKQSIDREPGLSDNVKLSPNVLNLLDNIPEAVYPSLEDFAVLDVSGMNKSILKNVNGFCKSFCDNINNGPEKYLNQDYLFSYVFFKSNLYENWQLMFEQDFPCNFEDLNKASKKVRLFDSYVIGKEEECFDYIEVPVRMFNKSGYVDIIVYIERTTEYMINEIEIKNWGKIYG